MGEIHREETQSAGEEHCECSYTGRVQRQSEWLTVQYSSVATHRVNSLLRARAVSEGELFLPEV